MWQAGHYQADLNVNGQWIRRSDTTSSPTASPSQKPYILFYVESDIDDMEVSDTEENESTSGNPLADSKMICPDCSENFTEKVDFMRHTIEFHDKVHKKVGQTTFFEDWRCNYHIVCVFEYSRTSRLGA